MVRKANTESQYRRVDHCAFLEPTIAGYCVRMLTDAKGCQQECDRSTDFGCNGVAIVPAVMPPTVYKLFRNVSLVPDNPQCSRSTVTRNSTHNHRVCYPLQQRIKVPLLPQDSYQVTDDPEDPIFYSTCLFRIPPSALATPPPPPPPREALYKFGTYCVECDEAVKSTWDHYIPRWNLSPHCIDCDKEFDASTVPKPVNYSGKHVFFFVSYSFERDS